LQTGTCVYPYGPAGALAGWQELRRFCGTSKECLEQKKKMDRGSQDGLDAPATGIIQTESIHDCESSGDKARVTERAGVRHADAELFHQSRWTGIEPITARGTGTSKITSIEEDQGTTKKVPIEFPQQIKHLSRIGRCHS
jgi:hypothetical protein